MRKGLIFILIGMYVGLIFVKSEVSSWFRIQEMFYFKSIHMYGTFALAILTSMIGVYLIKKFSIKTVDKTEIILQKKTFQKGTIYGGIMFGIGWAFTGSCPGPMYALVGTLEPSILITFAGVLIGVILYGLTNKKIPH